MASSAPETPAAAAAAEPSLAEPFELTLRTAGFLEVNADAFAAAVGQLSERVRLETSARRGLEARLASLETSIGARGWPADEATPSASSSAPARAANAAEAAAEGGGNAESGAEEAARDKALEDPGALARLRRLELELPRLQADHERRERYAQELMGLHLAELRLQVKACPQLADIRQQVEGWLAQASRVSLAEVGEDLRARVELATGALDGRLRLFEERLGDLDQRLVTTQADQQAANVALLERLTELEDGVDALAASAPLRSRTSVASAAPAIPRGSFGAGAQASARGSRSSVGSRLSLTGALGEAAARLNLKGPGGADAAPVSEVVAECERRWEEALGAVRGELSDLRTRASTFDEAQRSMEQRLDDRFRVQMDRMGLPDMRRKLVTLEEALEEQRQSTRGLGSQLQAQTATASEALRRDLDGALERLQAAEGSLEASGAQLDELRASMQQEALMNAAVARVREELLPWLERQRSELSKTAASLLPPEEAAAAAAVAAAATAPASTAGAEGDSRGAQGASANAGRGAGGGGLEEQPGGGAFRAAHAVLKERVKQLEGRLQALEASGLPAAVLRSSGSSSQPSPTASPPGEPAEVAPPSAPQPPTTARSARQQRPSAPGVAALVRPGSKGTASPPEIVYADAEVAPRVLQAVVPPPSRLQRRASAPAASAPAALAPAATSRGGSKEEGPSHQELVPVAAVEEAKRELANLSMALRGVQRESETRASKLEDVVDGLASLKSKVESCTTRMAGAIAGLAQQVGRQGGSAVDVGGKAANPSNALAISPANAEWLASSGGAFAAGGSEALATLESVVSGSCDAPAFTLVSVELLGRACREITADARGQIDALRRDMAGHLELKAERREVQGIAAKFFAELHSTRQQQQQQQAGSPRKRPMTAGERLVAGGRELSPLRMEDAAIVRVPVSLQSKCLVCSSPVEAYSPYSRPYTPV